jgi:DNA-binding ferritin-like protein (Dps family)
MKMPAAWIEKVTGSLEQKKQYKQYKARVKALPESYRVSVEALDRYLMTFGGITSGDTLVAMLEDLIELFEQSAASGTAIRDIVGEDPVEFAETFLENYSEDRWISKERRRLTAAIERAVSIEEAP